MAAVLGSRASGYWLQMAASSTLRCPHLRPWRHNPHSTPYFRLVMVTQGPSPLAFRLFRRLTRFGGRVPRLLEDWFGGRDPLSQILEDILRNILRDR